MIAWAFDPLQAGNAHFNLARLGATAGRYIDNMYGERTDALNAGVPTDRLIAEWDVDRRVRPSDPSRRGDGLAPTDRHDRGAGGESDLDALPVPLGIGPLSVQPAYCSRFPAISRG